MNKRIDRLIYNDQWVYENRRTKWTKDYLGTQNKYLLDKKRWEGERGRGGELISIVNAECIYLVFPHKTIPTSKYTTSLLNKSTPLPSLERFPQTWSGAPLFNINKEQVEQVKHLKSFNQREMFSTFFKDINNNFVQKY